MPPLEGLNDRHQDFALADDEIDDDIDLAMLHDRNEEEDSGDENER